MHGTPDMADISQVEKIAANAPLHAVTRQTCGSEYRRRTRTSSVQGLEATAFAALLQSEMHGNIDFGWSYFCAATHGPNSM